MADLVSGGYPQSSNVLAALGQPRNVYQGNIPGRTNLEWFGLGAMVATNALVASGVGAAVAVPVDPGTVITKITVLVTATAASTPTHSWGAIYAGTGSAPALIAASADALTTAIPANAPFTWTLSTPTLITQALAPYGFIYVSASVTGTAVMTVASVTPPTVAAFGTMVPPTGSPLRFSLTHGSALDTAPATIASVASTPTFAPVVLLT